MGVNEKKLNWRQACALIGCGKNRFYSLVRAGALPAYRMRGLKKGLWVYESDCLELAERIVDRQLQPAASNVGQGRP